MLGPSSVYSQGIVSARSRRIRYVAAVVLAAVILMGAYGTLRLMPQVRNTSRNFSAIQRHDATGIAPPHPSTSDLTERTHLVKVVRFEILFAYAYWTVWTLLVLTLILLAWIDLREVSRAYLMQRKRLYTDALKPSGTQGSIAESSSEATIEQPSTAVHQELPGKPD